MGEAMSKPEGPGALVPRQLRQAGGPHRDEVIKQVSR